MEFNDILGYGASLMVVVSLLMANMKLLRYLNLIGCILFVTYGVLIQAYPVAVMNGAAACINVYYLFKMYMQKSQKEASI